MITEKKIINDNNKIECRAECEAMNLIFVVTNAWYKQMCLSAKCVCKHMPENDPKHWNKNKPTMSARTYNEYHKRSHWVSGEKISE